MTKNELQTASKLFWFRKVVKREMTIFTLVTQCYYMCLLVVRPVFYFLLNGNVRLYFYVSCLS